MADRIDVIEDVLIHHRHQGAGRCTCGHVTRLGASLKRHPAEMVDKALGTSTRDALAREIATFTFTGSPNDPYRLADAILALVNGG